MLPSDSEAELQLTQDYLARLIAALGDSVGRLLLVSAVPRHVNETIIRILNDTDVSTEDFIARLRRYSFVETKAEGFVYHDSVRSLLLDNLRTGSPATYKSAHMALASHFSMLADNNPGGDTRFIGEAIYHQIAADADGSAALLRAAYERAESALSIGGCERLVQSAIAADSPSEQTRDWINYFTARLALLSGDHVVALQTLDALNSKGGLTIELRYEVLYTSGVTAGRLGDLSAAVSHHQAALEIARSLHNEAHVVANLYYLGRNYKRLGHFDRAVACHTEALSTPDSPALRGPKAAVFLDLGNVLTYLSRWDAAAEAFTRSQELYGSTSAMGEMEAVQRLGWLRRMTGDLDAAIGLHRRAVDYFSAIGIIFPLAAALHSLGNVYRDRRDWAKATELYLRALSQFERLSSRRHAGLVLRDLAYVEAMQGMLDSARERLARALLVLGDISDAGAYAEAIFVDGVLLLAGDDLALARGQAQECIRLASRLGNYELVGRALFLRSRAEIRLMDFAALSETGHAMLDVSGTHNMLSFRARGTLALGESALGAGNDKAGTRALIEAIRVAYLWNEYLGVEIAEAVARSLSDLSGVLEPSLIRVVRRDVIRSVRSWGRRYARAAEALSHWR